MSALFPDVPITAGVPNVLRDATNSLLEPDTAMTSDGSGLAADASPTWGIYTTGGDLAIEPDSFSALEYQKEEMISTFPVEQGGFQSYNKVETPYRLRVILTKGGSIDDRVSFLDQCEALRADTALYEVVTPETTYSDANVTRVGQVRNAQSGAQLMTVEMIVEEVRQTATTTFTPTPQSPSNVTPANQGSVQPQTTSDATASTPGGVPLPAGGQ